MPLFCLRFTDNCKFINLKSIEVQIKYAVIQHMLFVIFMLNTVVKIVKWQPFPLGSPVLVQYIYLRAQHSRDARQLDLTAGFLVS